MAILGTINKQAREILDFDINYDTVLAGRSDTIATQTSEVAPSGLTYKVRECSKSNFQRWYKYYSV
jgi:hypothetical protein